MRDKKLKYLVIVESPTKCSHIQEYLRKAGYNVDVMASYGHIAAIRDGGTYYNTGIEPNKDFEMDLAIADDKHDKVNRLKIAVKNADAVAIASDGDNEGAQISWSLIKFLGIPTNKYTRMITQEITPKAVVNAFENPVALDTSSAMASQARMCLDKIVGYRLSPIARTYIGAKSVGRCQSAGLKIIVDREREIKNFIPEKYVDLYLNFEKNKTKFKAKFIGTDKFPIEHLNNETEAKNVIKSCTGDYIVKNIIKKEKSESPKPPFTTLTMQQEVASKLGLSVKDTMSVCQRLFENGFISYHRTDSTEMSPEFVETLKDYIISTFGKKSFNSPKVGKKTGDEQEGHECLRITNPALTPENFATKDPNNLNQKVYKIIWQRTIAAALPSAIYSETTYNIYNKDYKFRLISKELLSEGFKIVYNYKDDEEEETGTVKETFAENEILQQTKLDPQVKETQPPKRFSEATFIKQLSKENIGRPSTTATIVETVLSTSRGYCNLENKLMVPTEKGIQLVDFLDRTFSNVINIGYTREMEKDLDLIAEGKLTKLEFLKSFYKTLEKTIADNKELKAFSGNETRVCPICGAPMVLRRSRYGKAFYGCSNYSKTGCKGIENLK